MEVDFRRVLRFSYLRTNETIHAKPFTRKDSAMTPTHSKRPTTPADSGLPLLLDIDPLSPLEASLAGVLGASVAALISPTASLADEADPQAAKRRAKDEDEDEAEKEDDDDRGGDEGGAEEGGDDDEGMDEDDEEDDDEGDAADGEDEEGEEDE